VARTIAGNIGATLTPEDARRLQVVRTVSPQAYDEYLLGKADFALQTADGDRRAIAHYRRAIALDSTFVDPHVGLVGAYRNIAIIGAMSPQEAGPLAKTEAERAVALDSGSAQAHRALASVKRVEWRWDEADREYRRALELNPGASDMHSGYASLLTELGRLDEAVQHVRRAVELDPRSGSPWGFLGYVYFYAGRFPESIAALQRALELDPADWTSRVYLASNFTSLGRHQEAIETVSRVLKQDPENQVLLQVAAITYAGAGRPVEARRYLDSLLAVGRKAGSVDAYSLGCVYAWLGETDRALAYFSRAADAHSANVTVLKIDWLPAHFKADPRYHALLRRIGLE
jgi:tetratricopeptide (TPR) repeat protein